MSITETAASVAARAFFYPSLAWNIARNRLQEDWHWWDEITEGVILGAIPFFSQLDQLKGLGVTAVVTLNEGFEVFITTEQYEEQGFTHLHIPTVDFLYAPPTEDLHKGADFINDHAQEGSKTYVHCKAGRGRSTTLVLCYLIKFFNQDPEQAYAFVRQKRPQVYLAQGQWMAVCAFFCSCHPESNLDPSTFPYPKFMPLAEGKQGSDGPEPNSDASEPNSSPLEATSETRPETLEAFHEEANSHSEAENNVDTRNSGLSQPERSCSYPSDNPSQVEHANPPQNEAPQTHECEQHEENSACDQDEKLEDEVETNEKGLRSCQPMLDSLTAALQGFSVQSLPESGGVPLVSEFSGFTPPARVASPAITIPQSGKPKEASNTSSKCSITIEPSGSLPEYVRIAPRKRGLKSPNSPVSVCNLPFIPGSQEKSSKPKEQCSFLDEDEEWASVDSDC